MRNRVMTVVVVLVMMHVTVTAIEMALGPWELQTTPVSD